MPVYLDRNIIAADTNSNLKIEKLTDAKAESIRSGLAVRIRIRCIARPNLLPELKLSIQALFHKPLLSSSAEMERHGCQPAREQCQIHWMDS